MAPTALWPIGYGYASSPYRTVACEANDGCQTPLLRRSSVFRLIETVARRPMGTTPVSDEGKVPTRNGRGVNRSGLATCDGRRDESTSVAIFR